MTVPGIGLLAQSSLSKATWGEFGARVGYKLTSNLTVDAFANGVFGNSIVNSSVHVGADLRYRF